ncbi:MAG: hypothetical protein Q7T78_20905 [Rhodoferax sp.]|nr:hypothetical protein [Rhodoferax sp.]
MDASKGNGLTAGNSQPAKELTNDTLNFTAPNSAAQLHVLRVLVKEKNVERWEIDFIGDVANGPDLIARLRALGLGKEHLVCTIRTRKDHFQRLKRYGDYSLTPLGKQVVRRALAGVAK